MNRLAWKLLGFAYQWPVNASRSAALLRRMEWGEYQLPPLSIDYQFEPTDGTAIDHSDARIITSAIMTDGLSAGRTFPRHRRGLWDHDDLYAGRIAESTELGITKFAPISKLELRARG
jgi:hypothetical protein